MIDLKEVIELKKVVVVNMVQKNLFQKVEFRFGNSSDFKNNIKIPYTADIQEKTPLIVDVDFKVSGRYLSLESKTTRLGFGPISVFKK